MNQNKKTLILGIFCFALATILLLPTQISAAITNPAIGALGTDVAKAESGSTFTGYFITLWRSLILVGVLILLFNLLSGGLDWILAGGESGKIQKAREKMVQSVIGMVVLASSFAAISYLSQLFFNFDLLNLTIPSLDNTGLGGSTSQNKNAGGGPPPPAPNLPTRGAITPNLPNDNSTTNPF